MEHSKGKVTSEVCQMDKAKALLKAADGMTTEQAVSRLQAPLHEQGAWIPVKDMPISKAMKYITHGREMEMVINLAWGLLEAVEKETGHTYDTTSMLKATSAKLDKEGA